MHEFFGPDKGTVDEIDMVNLGPPQHESEAYVPFCLQAGTEDRDGMDMGADVEDHGCRERSTESCKFFGVEKGIRYASGG